jgi:hypothetical protein
MGRLQIMRMITRFLKKLMAPKPTVAPHFLKSALPQPRKSGLKVANDMLRPQIILLHRETPK